MAYHLFVITQHTAAAAVATQLQQNRQRSLHAMPVVVGQLEAGAAAENAVDYGYYSCVDRKSSLSESVYVCGAKIVNECQIVLFRIKCERVNV